MSIFRLHKGSSLFENSIGKQPDNLETREKAFVSTLTIYSSIESAWAQDQFVRSFKLRLIILVWLMIV